MYCIATKFGTWGPPTNIINYANFFGNWLKGFDSLVGEGAVKFASSHWLEVSPYPLTVLRFSAACDYYTALTLSYQSAESRRIASAVTVNAVAIFKAPYFIFKKILALPQSTAYLLLLCYTHALVYRHNIPLMSGSIQMLPQCSYSKKSLIQSR